MKKSILLAIFILFGLHSLTAQNNKPSGDPAGTWKFEAPYAPEGYTAGTIILAKETGKYTATMSFDGSDYKLAGDKVKAAKDSLTFLVYLEGQDIQILLKIAEESKMTGKAVYSEGEVPLTLTRTTNQSKK